MINGIRLTKKYQYLRKFKCKQIINKQEESGIQEEIAW
jgi:hypothetical protein